MVASSSLGMVRFTAGLPSGLWRSEGLSLENTLQWYTKPRQEEVSTTIVPPCLVLEKDTRQKVPVKCLG